MTDATTSDRWRAVLRELGASEAELATRTRENRAIGPAAIAGSVECPDAPDEADARVEARRGTVHRICGDGALKSEDQRLASFEVCDRDLPGFGRTTRSWER